MNQADALDIVQSALWTVIVASGPAIAAAMAIGIIIGLLQALTQVQEMMADIIEHLELMKACLRAAEADAKAARDAAAKVGDK